jgi:iron(III) transport system substrate-binding protein
LPIVLLAAGCQRRRPATINLYVDPEPFMTYRVLWYFTQETHINVEQFHNPKFSPADSIKRLILEKDHPAADLYWGGDPIYSEVLRERGLTLPSHHQFDIPDAFQEKDNHWTGISARARVLLVRQGLTQEKPQSIRAYTDPAWQGKGALSDPLIGNMRSQFAALSVLWGDRELAAFYDALRKNGTQITKTPEESAALVSKGDADFTLVDTDVAIKEIEKGKPVEIVYPDQTKDDSGVMVIPNAVSVMTSCKNPEAAQTLVDFLTSLDSQVRLIRYEPSYFPLQGLVAITSPYIRRHETLHLLRFDYAAAAKKIVDMEKILETEPAPTSDRPPQHVRDKSQAAGRSASGRRAVAQ